MATKPTARVWDMGTSVHVARTYRGGPPWADWASKHGLDPRIMPAENLIVTDDVERTITYEVYEWPDRLPGCRGRTVVTTQLESPALPFPTQETTQ
jgi:hypothetical protein